MSVAWLIIMFILGLAAGFYIGIYAIANALREQGFRYISGHWTKES